MEKVSHLRKAGRILQLRCPDCGKASVFYRAKYPILRKPEMKKYCENCGYNFEKAPGYFLGAIYISYALAVLEGFIAFVLAKNLIFGLDDITLAMVTLAAILLCAVWNYRISRVIWMNFFSEKKKEIAN